MHLPGFENPFTVGPAPLSETPGDSGPLAHPVGPANVPERESRTAHGPRARTTALTRLSLKLPLAAGRFAEPTEGCIREKEPVALGTRRSVRIMHNRQTDVAQPRRHAGVREKLQR